MTHYHRDERDDDVAYLAERNPKTFFIKPADRRPLKHTLIDDLEEQGVLSRERLSQALDWYRSAWGYQYTLIAGAERVDLSGKRAGIVTQAEQAAAQKRIAAEKKEQREKQKTALLAAQVAVAAKHQANGAAVITKAAPTSHPLLPQLADMTSAIGVVRTVLVDNQFETMRATLAAVALKDILARTEKLISEINPD